MIDPLTHRLLCSDTTTPICLMYHSTPNGSAKSQWDVPLDKFKDQIKLLSDYGWQSKLISEFNQQPQKKTVFITFDDGFFDNYLAFQALIENSYAATWFIVTNAIGGNAYWETNSNAQRSILKPEQIRELSNTGMEIGSHTCSHAQLNQLTDSEAYQELNDSKLLLEDTIGTQIYSLAYPYGRYNKSIRDFAEKIGYQHACTTKSGFGFVNNDTLQIRRISIYAHDSLSTFSRKIIFGDNDGSRMKTLQYISHRLIKRLSRD